MGFAADVGGFFSFRFEFHVAGRDGKRHEYLELAKLRAKRPAKMFAMRGVERAVAESVIRAFKRDDAAFAGGEHRRLERGFDGFKTGVAENGFPVLNFEFLVFRSGGFVQRSNVIRLNSRASCALSACGCTSPIACSSFAICFCPALTTRGLAWPAAATPNAAVRSRYFFPSASQT